MKKMKFTTADLVKHLGLEVGDKVVVRNEKYELKETTDEEGYMLVDADGYVIPVSDLVDKEFEHYKRKKKIGETCCGDYALCKNCPLWILNCGNVTDRDDRWPLYRILNDVCYAAGIKSDNSIYLALRAKLDKEVE